MLNQLTELLNTIEQQEQAKTAELKELQDTRTSLLQLRDRWVSGHPEVLGTGMYRPAAPWNGVGITEGTEKLIREFGPMDTRNIAQLLRERGVSSKSKNFVPTVYTSLRESPRFVREGKKWMLATEEQAELKRKAKAQERQVATTRGAKKRGGKKR